MYYIDVKQESPNPGISLALFIGSFLLVVALYYASGFLMPYFAYADVLPFIAAVAFIMYFYRRYALAYRVVYSEGRIYVQRLSGGHGKPLWDCDVKDFGYFGEAKDAPPTDKTTSFVLSNCEKPVRMAVVNGAGAVTFHVDEKMIELIEAARNAPDPASENSEE